MHDTIDTNHALQPYPVYYSTLPGATQEQADLARQSTSRPGLVPTSMQQQQHRHAVPAPMLASQHYHVAPHHQAPMPHQPPHASHPHQPHLYYHHAPSHPPSHPSHLEEAVGSASRASSNSTPNTALVSRLSSPAAPLGGPDPTAYDVGSPPYLDDMGYPLSNASRRMSNSDLTSTPGYMNRADLRRQRNTEAARRSRARKLRYVSVLEARVIALQEENYKLTQQLAAHQAAVAALKGSQQPPYP
ncbi:hypothetical protein CXG81DRAFT_28323 [Caulochytrium protostelioides]|uniref:BZIP domain-containing protein n=1 Tax=Caulochytrium protostelioides TaxID=1555241 RepID=A0A4P9X1A0_9FUNG|nr:hypothetical protein CXG81DRAFT_28323 [Caulochytrium protostelioides]|eukprot:RKO98882.1 hypothetical protein CXG81DRAFT_28323 [Caulochytrium protostelioides]